MAVAVRRRGAGMIAPCRASRPLPACVAPVRSMVLAASLHLGVGDHRADQRAIVVPRDGDGAKPDRSRAQRDGDVVMRATGLVLEGATRDAEALGHRMQ